MNKTILITVTLFLAVTAGVLIGRQIPNGGGSSNGAGPVEREILYWVAPMDANYRRDAPGKSPMGMDLVPVYADEADARPGVVRIDPEVVSNLGVRTAVAKRGPLPRRIETVGYVRYDEDTVSHVHTRVDGWIEKLAAKATGDRVSRGQLLFELYSPTLVNAQEEFLAAERSGNAALRRASGARLTALGMSSNAIERLRDSGEASRLTRFYAETDGVIAHLGVREGIFVTPATEIMSVASIDRVWVIAEVFERQSNRVEPGQTAEVTLDYLPGTTLQGTVDYVYPELDPVTRTLRVRLRFDNPTENLRPNMFARVVIDGTGTGDIVHVPREAVVRSGTMNRVVVALGEGRYRSRRVRVGIESGDRVAIRGGLQAGETVVTSAQFLIDSESSIESALNRFGRDTEGAPQ